MRGKTQLGIIAGFFCLGLAFNARAFEGKIAAEIKEGETATTPLLYTVGANFLRIEVTGNAWPHPINVVDLKSGALTLIYPHNRSFMSVKAGTDHDSSKVREAPALPTPAAGIGAQPRPLESAATPPGVSPFPTPPGGLPPGIGPQSPGSASGPGLPVMPPMPMRPAMRTEKIELKPTGTTEEILGYPCQQFEIKSRNETMEIWATEKLVPFHPYLRSHSPGSAPRMIEEKWPALLTEKKIFPLRATLRFGSGGERFRFEVKSINQEKVSDPDGKIFRPPPDYAEIQHPPF